MCRLHRHAGHAVPTFLLASSAIVALMQSHCSRPAQWLDLQLCMGYVKLLQALPE